MNKKPTALILLLIALCLAPIIGGQINTEATTLAPGADVLLRSIFSGYDSIFSYFVKSYQPVPAIETPTLSHAIIGLLVIAAAILTLARRQVLQIPFMRVTMPLVSFMAWLICTLAFTSFMTVSIVSLCEWLCYGIVFFAVIANAGRRNGSQAIVTAIVIGCALVALKGLFEYGAQRPYDPSWRIFSTWANPTSLAGIMSIGLMLALGWAIRDEGFTSAIPWTCGLAMACAIMVTDSRGGILSMLGGLLVLSGFVLAWSTETKKRAAIWKIGSVLVLALLFGRWVHPSAASSHTSFSEARSPYVLAGQVTQSAPPSMATSQQVEQSSQFRFLLWRGAIDLIKANGLGYGIGTYRFHSGKPGLTTETQLAHNSYLQIGVEAGVLGFFVFLVFLVAWLLEVVRGCRAPITLKSLMRIGLVAMGSFLLFTIVGRFSHVEVFPTTSQKIVGSLGFAALWTYVELFRRSPNLTSAQNVLRASLIAAIICMLLDNMLESGLYSFGIGITAFAILGLGLVQAPDGIEPQYIPKPLRAAAGVLAFLIAVFLLHAGAVETLRARGRYELNSAVAEGLGSPPAQEAIKDANDIADKALNLAPFNYDQIDGENWRLKATVDENLLGSVTDLKEAASWEPNTRNLRALGIAQMTTQDYQSAIMNLNKALELDPNNLLTLPKLRDAYVAAGQMDKAVETAQRTIDVEKTPYFQVRSLPQLIPVETYEARAFIAAHTNDLNSRAQLLEQALAGYDQYRQVTVPLIKQMAQTDPTVQFGGENMALVQMKMRTAAFLAKELAATYRQLKRPEDAKRADQMAANFTASQPSTLSAADGYGSSSSVPSL